VHTPLLVAFLIARIQISRWHIPISGDLPMIRQITPLMTKEQFPGQKHPNIFLPVFSFPSLIPKSCLNRE
jgi:hypothetical protein